MPASSQIREVSLYDRTDHAELIVEGTVASSKAEAVPAQSKIYTTYRIRVARILKHGELDASGLAEVEFVTPGGHVGGEMHVVTPSLHPQVGSSGVFFLESRTNYAGRERTWVPTASTQGFVRYENGQAFEPFRVYADKARELIEPISRRSGEAAVVVDLLPPDPPPTASQGGLSITGFSPTTVRSGIQEVLTITGSGFGTSGSVAFDNADDGPGGPSGPTDPAHVVSWTDNEIQVYVPNRNFGVPAGSGRFVVIPDSGGFAFSPFDLTVEYGVKEILFDEDGPGPMDAELFRLNLVDLDRRGGYSFQYGTSTANNGVDLTSLPGAVDRFDEAVATWNCAAGWSTTIDGTTTVQSTGNDGINIVAFDNDADRLPLGVIGRTSSFFLACGGDSWYVSGLDIRFRRDDGSIDWYFGADPGGIAGSETDFASVAMHEVGHTIQLAHVNDSSDAMYFSLSPGSVKRSPSPAALAGAADILGHSSSFASCALAATRPFVCGVAPTAEFLVAPPGTCGTTLDVNFLDTSYDGPTSWTWSFGDGGMSTERNPSHTFGSAGFYTVSLTAENANGMDVETKSGAVIATPAPLAAFCDPSFVGYNDCCSLGVLNVSLNTIDHSTLTPTEGDPLYEDFTCDQMTGLQAGASYPISIVTGLFNDEDVRVYIDWNGDGSLVASEVVLDSFDAGTHSGTIVVPTTAVRNTALRMRVLSDWYPQGIFNPCDNIEFGQVEDYSIVVLDPPGPGGIPETSLRMDKDTTPGNVLLFWDPSCEAGAVDYAVYQGNLGDFESHTGVVCSTGGATGQGIDPGAPDRYYLVVPLSDSSEGSYGRATTGERPPGINTCKPTQNTTGYCP